MDHTHRKTQCKHILATMAHVAQNEADKVCGVTPDSKPSPNAKVSADVKKDAVSVTPDSKPSPNAKVSVDTKEDNAKPQVEISELGERPKCCVFCHQRVIKHGFTNNTQRLVQRYWCKSCEQSFVWEGGMERMRYPKWVILRALNDFCKGHSCREIADTLEQDGIEVHHTAIYRWIKKYALLIWLFLSVQPICTGQRYSADEKFVTVAGNRKYLFAVLDMESRLMLSDEVADTKDGHNATQLLSEAVERSGNLPTTFVTDKLGSYAVAFDKVCAPKTPYDKPSTHIANAGLGKRQNNNQHERFNSTFESFARPRRGIKRADSALFPLFNVYYNAVRKHSSLGNRTPFEATGVLIRGRNKWKTLIGNAWLASKAAAV